MSILRLALGGDALKERVLAHLVGSVEGEPMTDELRNGPLLWGDEDGVVLVFPESLRLSMPNGWLVPTVMMATDQTDRALVTSVLYLGTPENGDGLAASYRTSPDVPPALVRWGDALAIAAWNGVLDAAEAAIEQVLNETQRRCVLLGFSSVRESILVDLEVEG